MRETTNTISQKLFRGTKDQARISIQKTLLKKGYVIVSFLYFAQAMKFNLYKKTHNKKKKENTGEKNKSEKYYREALFNADFVFIDGIALQVFDRLGQFFFQPKQRQRTHNLNGTDFLPYLLTQTKDKKVGIIVSTLYDPKIDKGPERMNRGIEELEKQFPHIEIILKHQTLYSKRGQEFPFGELEKRLKKKKGYYEYMFFLNGISGPVQETRTEEHRDFFKDSNMIILNNGATLDYYSGFEKRAPQRVVKLRIGETLRRIFSQPKKNLKKFFAMFGIVPYRGYLIKKSLKKQK